MDPMVLQELLEAISPASGIFFCLPKGALRPSERATLGCLRVLELFQTALRRFQNDVGKRQRPTRPFSRILSRIRRLRT